MPKLYFYDSAIVCLLLGIESAEHLEIHSSRGAIFEGFVLSEMIKSYWALGKPSPLYFWRDYQGNEVDVVFERGGELIAVEIKSSSTLSSSSLNGLIRWQKISGSQADRCYLIYAGNETFTLNGNRILPWTSTDLD